MADKYHIGQKVRVIKSVNYPEFKGLVTIITEPRKRRNGLDGEVMFSYRLDIPSPTTGKGLCCEEDGLEPVYEGDTKASWSECAWQPKSLVKG